MLSGAVGRYVAAAGLACRRVTGAHLSGDAEQDADLTELLPGHWIMCWDADHAPASDLILAFSDGELHIVPGGAL